MVATIGLQSSRVVGVASEHLVAQGKAIEGHHHRDAHLLAVGAMIARIAARCACGFAAAWPQACSSLRRLWIGVKAWSLTAIAIKGAILLRAIRLTFPINARE
jgi:hypothetical protein